MPLTRSSSRLAAKKLTSKNLTTTTFQSDQFKTSTKVSSPIEGLNPTKKAKYNHSIKPIKTSLSQISSDHQDKVQIDSFDLEEAKAHLIKVDERFKLLFETLPCKPFEASELKNKPEPFQSLCKSILGQQVSWSAAKSITHKFIRLFFPDLPEKADDLDPSNSSFPTPSQVSKCSIERLRSSGASQRKAEYLLDLSNRFVNGQLSSQRLLNMNPDEIMNELCAVRGIGRWTVEMFLIFTIKHPNILPVSDLGIQKGLLRWYTNTISINSPKKPTSKLKKSNLNELNEENQISSNPITNSSSKTVLSWNQLDPPPLPNSSTFKSSSLKTRLTKPIKPGLYLTPNEMEELTESWKPFRSIAIWYLWSLTDPLAAPSS
ncbi:DNA glycosylase [Melampsora americana]|nr:DNA glycosylase [Melampsora americana]